MSLTDTAIKRLQPSDKCKPIRLDKYSDGSGLDTQGTKFGMQTLIKANVKI